MPPRFEVYRALSRQIHAIFAGYTDLIEPLALDEAYLDITANRQGIATARAIRSRILEETGLTASAGVSYNKLLAKLASSQRKPNGQFAIQPHEGEAFVELLPVAKFHGVGPATAAKMHSLGIQTGADLKAWSLPTYSLASVSLVDGITPSHEGRMRGSSLRTASASPRGLRPPSRKT